MTGHCQIDFYLLGSPALRADRLACKLALMAWERGHAIAVVTRGEEDAAALDDLMWDYPEGRFLPHERCGAEAGATAPVTILEAPPRHRTDVVINLTDEPLPDPQRYGRLLEIVPHQAADREASRKKFRAYRAQGIEPSTHEINAGPGG